MSARPKDWLLVLAICIVLAAANNLDRGDAPQTTEIAK
jgi:hypothetical protein